MSNLIRFALAVLATWRISHLLAREDGPLDFIARVRERLGEGFFGGLMDCFNCLSLWVAALVALYISSNSLDWLISWLALSGAACLLERIGPERLMIERLPEQTTGELDHGMLRKET